MLVKPGDVVVAGGQATRQIRSAKSHQSPIVMAYREYTDSERVFWRVWEVIPQSVERRRLRYRRHAERGNDRRRRHETRLALSNGDAKGWLVFESATEKRRLRPIPVGWFDIPDDALATLGTLAALAGRPSRRLIE